MPIYSTFVPRLLAMAIQFYPEVTKWLAKPTIVHDTTWDLPVHLKCFLLQLYFSTPSTHSYALITSLLLFFA